MEIGAKLKEITKEKHMTQGSLVKKVNEADDTLKMTDKKISDLFNGKRRILADELIAICKVLGVEIGEITK